VTPAAGQGQSSRTTTLNWGTDGMFPRTLTNPKGHITRLQWDLDTGNCTAGTVPLGIIRCVTDPNNLKTTFDFDGFGRQTRELRPDGTATDRVLGECTSANAFCNGASVLRWSVQNILRNTSNGATRTDAEYFDMFDQMRETRTETLSGANSRITSDYDSFGRLAARSEPFFDGNPVWNTSYSYDALGRPVQIQRQTSEKDTSISTTLVAYEGLRTTRTDPLSHTTTLIRNAVGEAVQMIDALGSDTDYEYDAFGNLLKTRDVLGNEVSATYNVRGMEMSSVDPDIGSWSYNYYPLGELKRQDDANTPSKHVDFTYDELSRPLTRIEAEGTTTFVFDTAVNGVGQLKSVTMSPSGYSETNSYDTLSRLSQVSVVADGTAYLLDQGYSSATGLLETLTYPTSTAGVRFKLRYGYASGLPQSVQQYTGDVLGTVYWQANATDARGQIIDEQLGNGLKTIAGRDRITGLLDSITSGPGGGSARQNHEYAWNKIGSLVSRREINLNHIETFFYDALDRLEHSQLDGVTNLTMTYNGIGNILTKSDVGGTYTYHATKKHAVTAAGSNAYTYDANGNALTRNGASITWASYNLPTTINFSDGSSSQFQYGADRSRFKQVAFTAGSGTETTIYIKDVFERLTRSATTEYKHYVFAPGGAVALYNRKSTGVNETTYLLNDHLGSVVMITNSSGGQMARLSNSAFGKRRNGGSWAGVPAASEKTAISNTTRRGFTQHEQVDNVALIHMNGRVFDPIIGRFLSADPYVPAPRFSQSWNRYSYTFNDPLNFTDPSGFGPVPGPDTPPPRPPRTLWPPFLRSLESIGDMVWAFVTPAMEVANAERNDARFQVAKSPTAGPDCANCPVPPLLARRGDSAGGRLTGWLRSWSQFKLNAGPPGGADSGIKGVFLACADGVPTACMILQSRNAEDLEAVMGFLRRRHSATLDEFGGKLPSITFTTDIDFWKEAAGRTDAISGDIHLAASYNSRADLAGTVFHELLHSRSGFWAREWVLFTDFWGRLGVLPTVPPENLGLPHTLIMQQGWAVRDEYRIEERQ
jgi:RHS repeat-associated protein